MSGRYRLRQATGGASAHHHPGIEGGQAGDGCRRWQQPQGTCDRETRQEECYLVPVGLHVLHGPNGSTQALGVTSTPSCDHKTVRGGALASHT